MNYEYNMYLTSDASQDIEFLFVEIEPSNWRIYILSNINYGGRSTGSNDIHRLVETDTTKINLINNFLRTIRNNVDTSASIYYICWNNRLNSLSDAHSVARVWGEVIASYIKNGGTFQSNMKNLKDRHII